MPQTALQICNSALVKIGGAAITAYGGTSSKEARLTTDSFPRSINLLTRSHVWAFLKKISTLTSVTTTTIFPWGYVQTLPSDLGRILAVTDASGSPIDYERVAATILTIESSAVLRYTANPIVPGTPTATEFPDDFAEALACYIAADICVSLTQNDDFRQGMLVQHEGLMRAARFNGACERSDYGITADYWLNSRDTYDSYERRDGIPLATP